MGASGISFWELLILLVIVLLLFGGKRLGSLGEDLGKAIKGFRNAMSDTKPEPPPTEAKPVQPLPPPSDKGHA